MSHEDQNHEWKESWRDEYLRWLCGFANAEGGTLVIGKRDDGTVVGASNAPKLLVELPNKIRDFLGIVAEVNLETINGKELIEIRVEAYPNPISYKGEYHFRSGSTKQELRGAALDQFLLRKYGRTWDAVPVPHLSDDDLDPQAFKLFRSKAARSGRMDEDSLAGSDSVLMDRLKLRDRERLTRAAGLLFHPHPDQLFVGASIKIGFFANEVDLLYQDEVEGSLYEQVDKALDLLTTKYMKAFIRYEGFQRIESLPFPREAVREVLLNAVVHKDYASGIPVQIKVYIDRIVFWNTGHPAQDWTVERLLAPHPSHPYNPLVAGGFFRAGMIESWGRGIEKIRQACREHGTPEPIIRLDVGGLWVELFALPASEMTPEMTPEMPATILTLLTESPQPTLDQIAQRLAKGLSTVKRAIKKLQEQGTIEHTGPNKGGRWVVKK